MNKYFLSEINIYPIKSLGGISLQSAEVEDRGLKHDRRWMLVDESNRFITQRSFAQMALLRVDRKNGLLLITHKQNKLSPLTIQPFQYDEEEVHVQIWRDNVVAFKYQNDVNEWFTKAIGIKCSLVYMPETTKRKTNPDFAKDKIVSFADGYPFLLIGEESLVELNNHLGVPLTMNRFRPNLVFKGGGSFDEDTWKKVRIGDAEFIVVKPCARCIITTINQETAERGKEPLKTLAKFRNSNGEVLFGHNMVSYKTGVINIGDELYPKE
ncbi:MAG: MOSC domain-containing protein [Ignavibacterium sp.]|nr:MAG: MOSC domain-containing protein [Ignavibacterium sp.]